jgi:hypothetical protein
MLTISPWPCNFSALPGFAATMRAIRITCYSMIAIYLPAGRAQSLTPLCSPKIVADQVVASAAQREAAGDIAQPPLTDLADGFAWSDTPVGAIKTGGGYAFFGSDGGSHARQFWQGRWYGNNKYGSITRTLGTLDHPL